jgi:predicted secreted acid phosphatase
MLRSLFIAVVALCLASCASSPREPKPNLTLLKWRCIEWHDSGGYARAFEHAAKPASRTLEHYLRGETPQNFAIVFDIDETLLSNWPYIYQSHFGIDQNTFATWAETSRDRALHPLQEIFNRAHAYQIPIFLVTGRDESLRAATLRNLEEAGYWGWSGLYMKPSSYREVSIIPFKSGVRKMLTERGYDIILNIGDQHSDLDGGYAHHRVKLPNPFYYLP